MSTFIRSAIVAVALLAGASAAIAQPVERHHYSNSPDSVRAFWDAQQRNGS